MISASVDDRTPEERSLEVVNFFTRSYKQPLSKSKHQIRKSRYDSISLYLSPGPMYSGGCCSVESLGEYADIDANRHHFFRDEYNDLNAAYDQEILEELVKGGMYHT